MHEFKNLCNKFFGPIQIAILKAIESIYSIPLNAAPEKLLQERTKILSCTILEYKQLLRNTEWQEKGKEIKKFALTAMVIWRLDNATHQMNLCLMYNAANFVDPLSAG